MKKISLPLLVILLWIVAPFLFNAIQPNDYTGGNMRDEYQRQIRNSSAASRMLGGLRTSVSDIMFLKIETYMHEGVGYEPHVTEVESVSSLIEEDLDQAELNDETSPPEHVHSEDCDHGGEALHTEIEHVHSETCKHGPDDAPPEEEHVHSEDCDHGGEALHAEVEHVHSETCEHGHDAAPAEEEHVHSEDCEHEHDGTSFSESGEKLYAGQTTIPIAQQDYRGFIGNLYRKVKPWSGAALHKHSKGEELLPWFKVMTLSDPQYIRGYTIGSYWLSRTDLDGGLKFIEEGAKNNPDSFEVHLIYGQLLYKKAQDLRRETGNVDLPLAYDFINNSLKHYRQAADLVLKVRPLEGPSEISGWSNTQEQDAWAAITMALTMESKFGDPNKAVELAQRSKAQFGDSPWFENILNPVESLLPNYLN